MKSQALLGIGILILLLSAAAQTGRAQSQAASPDAQQPPAATPAPPAAPAQTPTVTKPKTAKVWTNEDVTSLPSDRGVSVVGKSAPAGTASAASKPNAMEKDPAWYRKQLQPLQAEIARLDEEIAKTKAFLAGERVDESAAPYTAYYRLPGNPQEKLKQLEAQRDKDEAKVEDLLDLARHNGIEPGALR